ncbi:MAG: PLP-dependent lyase/thiolase [Patescibacteria group bacterium]
MITPHEHYPELAKVIGLKKLYFKREDLHPYGSHKGRSIPFMIDYYYKKSDRKFAISSSGNAALAAALYAKELNKINTEPIDLDIFVGNNVMPRKLEKLRKLADEHIRILIKERPLQALVQAVQEGKRSLRQSTDDIALIGYESLARELAEIKGVGAIFIGTSSGTTAQALAECFLKNKLPIQVHIIQTSSCHPIADTFESFSIPNEKSIADAIVDQTAYRKDKLVQFIRKTGGRGWLAINENILNAQELVAKHTGLEISTNSALSIVGAMQAAYLGYEIKGAIVCMICGE